MNLRDFRCSRKINILSLKHLVILEEIELLFIHHRQLSIKATDLLIQNKTKQGITHVLLCMKKQKFKLPNFVFNITNGS